MLPVDAFAVTPEEYEGCPITAELGDAVASVVTDQEDPDEGLAVKGGDFGATLRGALLGDPSEPGSGGVCDLQGNIPD